MPICSPPGETNYIPCQEPMTNDGSHLIVWYPSQADYLLTYRIYIREVNVACEPMESWRLGSEIPARIDQYDEYGNYLQTIDRCWFPLARIEPNIEDGKYYEISISAVDTSGNESTKECCVYLVGYQIWTGIAG